MTTIPIYTKETLQAFTKEYCRRLKTREEGTQRTIIGRVRGDQLAECSYFIARRLHREKVEFTHRTVVRGRTYLPTDHYYRTLSRDYVIARISWRNHVVEEIAVFNTADAAGAALRKYHKD